jgi:long-subunit fatty acid transport protein
VKSRRILLIIVVFFILCGVNPQAAVSSGSIFSGLGYGVLEDFSSSRAVGMGNAGLALPDSSTLNFSNPALLADLRKTRIAVGGFLARHDMRDHYASDLDDWGQVEYFGLGFPLKKGLVIAGLFSPFSRVDFKYGWSGQLSGVPYFESYQGTGGLSRAALDLAWAVHPRLSVGGSACFLWGEVEEVRGSYFDASGYLDAEFVTSKQWRSFSGEIGIRWQPVTDLTLGVLYQPESPIHLDQLFSYTNEDSTITTEKEYRLPARIGFGFSYRISPRWLSAVSAHYASWGALAAADLPSGPSGYRDAYRLGGGLEWEPGSWDADHFFKRLTYRLGAGWASDYVLAENSVLHAYSLTLGWSYPFHEARDRVDFSLEITQRGNLSENGGQELIYKFRLGLNLGETWFQRAKPPWLD